MQIIRPVMHRTSAALFVAAISGCAASPQPSTDGPLVQVAYRDAISDLALTKAQGWNTITTHLKPTAAAGDFHLNGPYLSEASKCNADHSVCKHGIVKLTIRYTVRRVGADWILEGDMESSLSRSDTAVMENGIAGSKTTFSATLRPDEVLIDDEHGGKQHFRWAVSKDAPLELHGPAGSLFRLQGV